MDCAPERKLFNLSPFLPTSIDPAADRSMERFIWATYQLGRINLNHARPIIRRPAPPLRRRRGFNTRPTNSSTSGSGLASSAPGKMSAFALIRWANLTDRCAVVEPASQPGDIWLRVRPISWRVSCSANRGQSRCSLLFTRNIRVSLIRWRSDK